MSILFRLDDDKNIVVKSIDDNLEFAISQEQILGEDTHLYSAYRKIISLLLHGHYEYKRDRVRRMIQITITFASIPGYDKPWAIHIRVNK